MGSYNFPDYADDDEDYEKPFRFGTTVDKEFLKSGSNKYPLISYNYIDLGDTEYHFSQDCFDNLDLLSYFKQLKKFSNLLFRNLMDNSSHHDHFKIEPKVGPKIKRLLEKVYKKPLTEKTTPLVGHFALYTNPESARDTKIKSPRIFFILGKRATIHILFYDPYHEIHGRSAK